MTVVQPVRVLLISIIMLLIIIIAVSLLSISVKHTETVKPIRRDSILNDPSKLQRIRRSSYLPDYQLQLVLELNGVRADLNASNMEFVVSCVCIVCYNISTLHQLITFKL